MTAITSRFVGRPVSAAPDDGPITHDKWALVDALTRAAEDFGLSHRSIAVLRTMLTFVPERDLPARLGRAIVFASNDTLSARLGGMPESTLRRHLSALVNAGVIMRHDSPNRKRYVKKLGNGIACAFGFDLGPLAIMANDIQSLAHTRDLRAQERAVLHTQVLVARQALLDTGIDPEAPEYSPLFARARLMLRRKDNNEDLRALLSDFAAATDLDATDSQNERHQHKETYKNSESEGLLSDDNLSPFTEYHRMFPQGANDWPTLTRQVLQLVPMMGIEALVYEEAKRHMGPRVAPLAILGILERFETIINPGGYLRTLTKQARNGGFDVRNILTSC
ncbi:MAG: hypothetical protein HWE26_22850 [Alteromonadaceae bacterium]|nr:hypothetical protein [Alteromonadaceae bacterium]